MYLHKLIISLKSAGKIVWYAIEGETSVELELITS